MANLENQVRVPNGSQKVHLAELHIEVGRPARRAVCQDLRIQPLDELGQDNEEVKQESPETQRSKQETGQDAKNRVKPAKHRKKDAKMNQGEISNRMHGRTCGDVESEQSNMEWDKNDEQLMNLEQWCTNEALDTLNNNKSKWD